VLPAFEVEAVDESAALAGNDKVGLESAYRALVVRYCGVGQFKPFPV
jgi:hypothetical protein